MRYELSVELTIHFLAATRILPIANIKLKLITFANCFNWCHGVYTQLNKCQVRLFCPCCCHQYHFYYVLLCALCVKCTIIITNANGADTRKKEAADEVRNEMNSRNEIYVPLCEFMFKKQQANIIFFCINISSSMSFESGNETSRAHLQPIEGIAVFARTRAHTIFFFIIVATFCFVHKTKVETGAN